MILQILNCLLQKIVLNQREKKTFAVCRSPYTFGFEIKLFKRYNKSQLIIMPLDIANYVTANPEKIVKDVINDFVFMRRHKKEFTVEKPQFLKPADDSAWRNQEKTGFYFMQQQNQSHKILIKVSLNDSYKLPTSNNRQPNQNTITSQNGPTIKYSQMKTKIIQKVAKQSINRNLQRQLQKKYKRYLLNYLHKSNLLQIANQIPPSLSVLETVDDGQFLPDGQKKDFPHWSNVLQVTDLPSQKCAVVFQKKLLKIQERQRIFTNQDNTIFKIKHLPIFLDEIFNRSAQYVKKIKLMNISGDNSLKPENQNHNFQQISEKIGLSFRTCKLLYDILNDHFDLQGELKLGRSQEDKTIGLKEIKKLLLQELQEYYRKLKEQDTSFMRHSSYIPMQQSYLSLKDLRMIFIQVYQE